MADDDDFSGGIAAPPSAGLVDRRTYLVDRARGRRVVHLGCVDDRLTETRAATGELLHAHIAAAASTVVGVDISRPGIERMEGLVPGPYVVGDVEELMSLDLPGECDVVIASEIIEHLGRPAAFLDGLADYLARTGATALITTPNSYSWTGFARFARTRNEPTHPDHVAMYSPVTLVGLLERSPLRVVAMRGHRWAQPATGRGRVRGTVDRAILRRRPWLAVGLVAEVEAARGC